MFYITEDDIIRHEKRYKLNFQYNGVQPVLVTCFYYCFIPDSDSHIIKSDVIQ